MPYLPHIISPAILMLFLAVAPIHAQERSDKVNVSFIKKSEPITKATGYMQNEASGKWVQNENLIKDIEVAPKDSFNRGFTAQNLIWFRTATLQYNSKKYYAFYYYYHSGQYKYPETKVDWMQFHATRFLIADQDQYNTFKKAVMDKKGEFIKLSTIIASVFEIEGDYDEPKLLGLMTKALGDDKLFNDYCVGAISQTLNGKSMVRFRLPEDCYFTQLNLGDKQARYFEISFDEFKKILID
jgi:hypothetical protein